MALATVPRVTTAIDDCGSFTFHNFFRSLVNSMYLPFLSHIISIALLRVFHTRVSQWSSTGVSGDSKSLQSLRVFELLSTSLLLLPQRSGRYVLRLSSGVCRSWEPTQNFELRTLLNPRGSPLLIPLAITRYKCLVFLYCYSTCC